MAFLIAGLSFGIGLNPPIDIHVPSSDEIYDFIESEAFDIEGEEHLSICWIIDTESRSEYE